MNYRFWYIPIWVLAPYKAQLIRKKRVSYPSPIQHKKLNNHRQINKKINRLYQHRNTNNRS